MALRGQEGVDLDALEDLPLHFSRLAADFPEIVEPGLNPILSYPTGETPEAVGVRMRVRSAPATAGREGVVIGPGLGHALAVFELMDSDTVGKKPKISRF